MSENQTEIKKPEEIKLNSYTALADIWNVDAKSIKEAEEKGTMEELKAKFANENFVYSMADKIEFTKNIQNNYLEDLVKNTNIPQTLYDKIKGGILEKQERVLKNSYGFDGQYENFNSLVDNIIREKAKQPNVSKSEDLQRIKDLELQVSTSQDVAQKNLNLRSTISEFEEKKNAEFQNIKNIYETDKRNSLINSLINKIPFDDGDKPHLRETIRKAFKADFLEKVDVRFDEKLTPFAVDRASNIRIDNNLQSPMSIEKVMEKTIKEGIFELKTLKQGANITSSTNNGYVIRNMEDAQRYIAENNIVGTQEQIAVFEKIPVKQK